MVMIDELTSPDYVPPSPSLDALNNSNQGAIVDLINSIKKVEKLKPKIAGDPHIFRFYIADKIMIIPSDRMIKPTMFNRRFLEEFDCLAPSGLYTAMNWALFIKSLSETKKLIKIEDETLTIEVFEAENILTSIRKSKTTEDKAEFAKKPNLLLMDKDKVFVCSDNWKTQLDNIKPKTPIDRLLGLMKGYFIKRTSKKCTDGKQVWCYVFNRRLVEDRIISLSGSLQENTEAEAEHEI